MHQTHKLNRLKVKQTNETKLNQMKRNETNTNVTPELVASMRVFSLNERLSH